MTIFEFLRELERRSISYRVERFRDTLAIVLAVPGERWEVEFDDQGRLEIERFKSDGEIYGEDAIADLWPLAE